MIVGRKVGWRKQRMSMETVHALTLKVDDVQKLAEKRPLPKALCDKLAVFKRVPIRCHDDNSEVSLVLSIPISDPNYGRNIGKIAAMPKETYPVSVKSMRLLLPKELMVHMPRRLLDVWVNDNRFYRMSPLMPEHCKNNVVAKVSTDTVVFTFPEVVVSAVLGTGGKLCKDSLKPILAHAKENLSLYGLTYRDWLEVTKETYIPKKGIAWDDLSLSEKRHKVINCMRHNTVYDILMDSVEDDYKTEFRTELQLLVLDEIERNPLYGALIAESFEKRSTLRKSVLYNT